MIYLKQSTASQEVLLGPFVDSTDGVTAETGLTIANTDIKIHKAGATTLADKNSGGATHISGGNYYAVCDATDTNTLGSGCILVQVAGALAVRVDFCVLSANVYDSIVGGGDLLDVSTTQFNGSAVTAASGRPEVNVTHAAGTAWGSGAITAGSIASDAFTAAKFASDVTTELQSGLATASALSTVAGYLDTEVAAILAAVDTEVAAIKAVTDQMVFTVANQLNVNAVAISGDATAADNLETAFDDTAGAVPWQGIIDQGTAQAATATTLRLRSAAAFADDQIIGAIITITGGSAGIGQSREITDYVSSTDTATVDTWTTTPTGTITYKIYAAPPAPATAPAVNLTHIGGAAVSTTTAQLGVNVVQISGDSGAADNLEAAADGTGYNLGGGSVVAASVTGAVGSVTGNVGGNVTGSVGTVNALAANAITAAATATDFGTEVATAVWASATRVLTAGTNIALAKGTGVTGFNDLSAAQVNAEVDTALSDIHLDHLLAADYDPASKPGVSTALLNELVESDSGVSRFTANALENAPVGEGGGGSGDWTTGEKEQIRHRLGIDGDANAASATPSLATAAAAAAIEADTQDIQGRLPAALVSGRIDASVGAMGANVMTAAAAASDLTTELQSGLATASALSSVASAVSALPAASAIADAVWDEVVDGVTTARESARLSNSVLGGKVSGAGTGTEVVRDLADSKARVTYTVDEDGNRPAVTRDLT